MISTKFSQNQQCVNRIFNSIFFFSDKFKFRFAQFARDTEAIGSERVLNANSNCDDVRLIIINLFTKYF